MEQDLSLATISTVLDGRLQAQTQLSFMTKKKQASSIRYREMTHMQISEGRGRLRYKSMTAQTSYASI